VNSRFARHLVSAAIEVGGQSSALQFLERHVAVVIHENLALS
jgi:hypothetical protein